MVLPRTGEAKHSHRLQGNIEAIRNKAYQLYVKAHNWEDETFKLTTISLNFASVSNHENSEHNIPPGSNHETSVQSADIDIIMDAINNICNLQPGTYGLCHLVFKLELKDPASVPPTQAATFLDTLVPERPASVTETETTWDSGRETPLTDYTTT